MINTTTRPIPCHMCHTKGSLFYLLRQCKIPLLVLNSAKHPIRSFMIFSNLLYYHFDIYQNSCFVGVCRKSVICVTMKRNSKFGHLSHIKLTSIAQKMNKKVNTLILNIYTIYKYYIICFQERAANNTVLLFLGKNVIKKK